MGALLSAPPPCPSRRHPSAGSTTCGGRIASCHQLDWPLRQRRGRLWALGGRTRLSGGYLSAGGLPIPTDATTRTAGGQGWLGRVGGGFDYQFNSASSWACSPISTFPNRGHLPTILWWAFRRDQAERRAGRAGPAGWSRRNFTESTQHRLHQRALCLRDHGRFYSPGGGTSPPARRPATACNGVHEADGSWAAAWRFRSAGWFWRNEYRYAYYGNDAIQDLNIFSPNPTSRFNDSTSSLPSRPSRRRPSTNSPGAGAPCGRRGRVARRELDRLLCLCRHRLRAMGRRRDIGHCPGRIADEQLRGPAAVRGQGLAWPSRRRIRLSIHVPIVAGVFADFDFSSLKGNIQDRHSLRCRATSSKDVLGGRRPRRPGS